MATGERYQTDQVGAFLWYIHDNVEGRWLDVEVLTEQDALLVERALNTAALLVDGVTGWRSGRV